MAVVIVCWLSSILFLTLAGQVGVGWGLASILAAVVMAAAGLAEFIQWNLTLTAKIRKENRAGEHAGELAVLAERRAVLERVLQLDAGQAKLVQSYTAVIIALANPGEPVYMLQIGEHKIPWAQAEEFVARCSLTHLAPVGLWSEGTEMRQAAQIITAHMVRGGYAEPASGNRPARWIDRRGGLLSIGMTDAE